MNRTHFHTVPRYIFGLTAMILALLFIYRFRSDVIILAASGYLFLICATDTLYSRIPNVITLALVIIGVIINMANSGLSGLMISTAGFFVGLGLLLIPFLLGGMGAGDVKGLAALGALLGPGKTFQIFIYMGLIGGLLGVVFHLFSADARQQLRHYFATLKNVYLTREFKALKPSEKRLSYRFPYATAIAFGFYAFIFWGDIL